MRMSSYARSILLPVMAMIATILVVSPVLSTQLSGIPERLLAYGIIGAPPPQPPVLSIPAYPPDYRVKCGANVSLGFHSSCLLIENDPNKMPRMTVNGHDATYTGHTSLNYYFTYTIRPDDPEGHAVIYAEGYNSAGKGSTTLPTYQAFIVDNTSPTFWDFWAYPSFASASMPPVVITFGVTETLSTYPTVTVNGNQATFQNVSGNPPTYTYHYQVLYTDPLGQAEICVSGTDKAGNPGSAVNNTALIIVQAPPLPKVKDDGAYTTDHGQLHAIWTVDDPGIIERYEYAIGTAPGLSDIVGWTNVGMATEVIVSDLTLTTGITYYFSVRAYNDYNTWSQGESNGITVLDEVVEKVVDLSLHPDGTYVGLTHKLVTLGSKQLPGLLYAQDAPNIPGYLQGSIMVLTDINTIRQGDDIAFAGCLCTDAVTAERFIQCSSVEAIRYCESTAHRTITSNYDTELRQSLGMIVYIDGIIISNNGTEYIMDNGVTISIADMAPDQIPAIEIGELVTCVGVPSLRYISGTVIPVMIPMLVVGKNPSCVYLTDVKPAIPPECGEFVVSASFIYNNVNPATGTTNIGGNGGVILRQMRRVFRREQVECPEWPYQTLFKLQWPTGGYTLMSERDSIHCVDIMEAGDFLRIWPPTTVWPPGADCEKALVAHDTTNLHNGNWQIMVQTENFYYNVDPCDPESPWMNAPLHRDTTFFTVDNMVITVQPPHEWQIVEYTGAPISIPVKLHDGLENCLTTVTISLWDIPRGQYPAYQHSVGNLSSNFDDNVTFSPTGINQGIYAYSVKAEHYEFDWETNYNEETGALTASRKTTGEPDGGVDSHSSTSSKLSVYQVCASISDPPFPPSSDNEVTVQLDYLLQCNCWGTICTAASNCKLKVIAPGQDVTEPGVSSTVRRCDTGEIISASDLPCETFQNHSLKVTFTPPTGGVYYFIISAVDSHPERDKNHQARPAVSNGVKYTLVDVDIYQPGTFSAPGSLVPDVEEEDRFNVVADLNDDYDDGLETPDNADKMIGPSDDDIVKVTLRGLTDLPKGTLTLVVDPLPWSDLPGQENPGGVVRVFKADGYDLEQQDYSVTLSNPTGYLAPLASSQDVDIYLEGMNQWDEVVIRLDYEDEYLNRIYPTGSDEVRLIIVDNLVDIEVDEVGEDLEEIQGAFIPRNDDDDNYNDIEDYKDITANGDDDLVPITIAVNPSLIDGEVTLEVGGSNPEAIRLWTDQDKTTEVELPHAYTVGVDLLPMFPLVIYVEGLKGTPAQAVMLKATYRRESLELIDIAAISVFNATIVQPVSHTSYHVGPQQADVYVKAKAQAINLRGGADHRILVYLRHGTPWVYEPEVYLWMELHALEPVGNGECWYTGIKETSQSDSGDHWIQVQHSVTYITRSGYRTRTHYDAIDRASGWTPIHFFKLGYPCSSQNIVTDTWHETSTWGEGCLSPGCVSHGYRHWHRGHHGIDIDTPNRGSTGYPAEVYASERGRVVNRDYITDVYHNWNDQATTTSCAMMKLHATWRMRPSLYDPNILVPWDVQWIEGMVRTQIHHMLRNQPNFPRHSGGWINRNERFGFIDLGGNTTGEHAHFGVRRNNRARNPDVFMDFSLTYHGASRAQTCARMGQLCPDWDNDDQNRTEPDYGENEDENQIRQ